jgi:hypothetical protein
MTSFVFNILQNGLELSGLFGILCRNRYPRGGVHQCQAAIPTTIATRPRGIVRFARWESDVSPAERIP